METKIVQVEFNYVTLDWTLILEIREESISIGIEPSEGHSLLKEMRAYKTVHDKSSSYFIPTQNK